MSTTQIQINHLIKTLAEQLRHAESLRGIWEVRKQRTASLRLASKCVAELEKLGVQVEESFTKADTLNLSLQG